MKQKLICNSQMTSSISKLQFKQQQISKLKNNRKYLIMLLIFFIFSTMILSLSVFFNIKIISNTKQILSSDQEFLTQKYEQSCSKIQLSNSSLTNFQFKMQFDDKIQNKLQQKSSPFIFSKAFQDHRPIISLDLASNKLQKISSNSLPDLKIINISNNKILKFSDNNFPSLEKIVPWYIYSEIEDFSNNHLPLLVELQTKFIDFSSIKKFSYNNMPLLNAQLFIYSQTTKFESNILGATMLYMTSCSQQLRFFNNKMKKVKQLIITHQKSTLNISNNSFQSLQVLIVSGLHSIENNYLPALIQLNLNGQFNLFFNQSLPKLKKLTLFSPTLTDICDGVQMPNLQTVEITSNNLTNLNCLDNFKKIQSLDLDVSNFSNFNFPNLKYLWLSFNQNSTSHSFFNNSFPNIKQIKLFSLKNITTFKLSNIDIGVSLQKFVYTYTNLTYFVLFDKQMPNLTEVHLKSNKLISLDCTKFKNVKDLYLSLNTFKDDIIDTLIDCQFNQIKNIFLEENIIADKPKAKAKLQSRYPTTFISL